MTRKLSIFLLALTFGTTACAQLRTFTNPYQQEFEEAYALHAEIPKGILEAVVYNRSNFRNIDQDELESCTGLPKSMGLFGLVEDGKGYFNNTLHVVSELSGIDLESIRSDEATQIKAYAQALEALQVAGWDGREIAERLMSLSELPMESSDQMFAMEIQLFEVISLLNDREFMSKLGHATLDLDLEEIFGENLSVLSAKKIFMSGESIYNEIGETYRAGGGIAPCYNYAADAFVQTPSCKYSSRSGTAISAVTIHTF